MMIVRPETKENLLSAALLPAYGLGWVAGKIVRLAEVVWTAVAIGYREARGGRQPME